MGRQYDKQHAATVVATAVLAANRFVAYSGGYASGAAGAGGAADTRGVSEHEAAIGDAVSVVTGYSALVEAGDVIAANAFVKPGVDGKAVAGTIADNCGRALEAAAAAGQLIEVVLQPHVHPTV
ncbi:MAG: hypothetical protein AzoDbin1_05147 [Azoarcus sp.]|nr:hypothetical protein [Azoarcus sp.]